MALVPQRLHLFYGSVLENIQLARPDASRAEIEWAAELAGQRGLSGVCRTAHRHPYGEVFVVQEGNAPFTAGEETIEVGGGQVVEVPVGGAHKFVNSGTGRLRQVDIHASYRFDTEWLED